MPRRFGLRRIIDDLRTMKLSAEWDAQMGMQELAIFACAARRAQINGFAFEQLQVRLLDALGVAIAALREPDLMAERARIREPADADGVALIGGGRAAPERAAALHVRLIRRLGWMDAYLAPAGVVHPSDTVAALLALGESRDATGAEFLIALGVAYAVYVALSDARAPATGATGAALVTACATAAGAAKLLRLDAPRAEHLVAALASRSAAPDGTPASEPPDPAEAMAALAADAVAIARACISGAAAMTVVPPRVDLPAVDWRHVGLDGVRRTLVRRYAASVHAQSAIDAAIGLSKPPLFDAARVNEVRVKVNQAAFDALGGRLDDEALRVRSPAQAQRSLRWLVAVALLDRDVGSGQFSATRIARDDVQALLRRVAVEAYAPFTARYPESVCSQVEVRQADGTTNCVSASSFEGFTLQPLGLIAAYERFRHRVAGVLDASLATRIFECVRGFERARVRDLAGLLAAV